MSKFAALAAQVDRPARMTITHPGTGQPLRDAATKEPGWIDLLSLDSEVAQRQNRIIRDRRLSARGRKLTAAELDAEAVDLFAALTVGWSLVGLDGRALDVPCNTANAAELYGMRELSWLREQVDLFLGERGNWLPS